MCHSAGITLVMSKDGFGVIQIAQARQCPRIAQIYATYMARNKMRLLTSEPLQPMSIKTNAFINSAILLMAFSSTGSMIIQMMY